MTEPTALSLSVEDGIAVLTFDLPGESVNKFSPAVIEEFTGYLALLERDQAVRAAVLISGKPGTFIAGADIDQFLAFRSADDAAQASAFGHTIMRRIETGRVPLVVAVEGACLGGGLEFALAAGYRLAVDTPKTVFSLPEIKLGLIPGAGGTQRLPRRIGVQAALDMILTGKNVRAKKAKQLGLIDEIVHPSLLREVAIRRARELAEGKIPRIRETRRRTTMSRALDDTAVGRAIVLRQARQLAMKKSGGNYPAIPAAIDAVRSAFAGSESAGYATEARLFGQLAMSSVCKELMFLFYATTALKKDAGVPEGTVVAKVDRIAVVGSGFMGAGIAAVSAQQGIPVRFKDTALERVAAGLASVRDVLREGLTRKHITRREYEDRVGLVSGTASYTGFGRILLVIEAVFEDLGVKHTVVRELEQVLPADAVLATNTSTIPIARIAEASARPERVIGMHFFSPVHKMPLLEVVVTPKTAPEVTATAVEFGRRIGKTVIVVNDAPGFYVNRILAPYIAEAGRLLDEGVRVEAIDRAMRAFGFPVGPFTLIDEVGLDIAGKSGAIMAEAFGDRIRSSEALARVVAAGRLGRKGGKGFYGYDEKGKRTGVDRAVYALYPGGARKTELSAHAIQQRLVLAMVNEAVRCLADGVVRSPRDGDIGAVFGIGFPPFRGGPFRYIDATGAGEIVSRLEALAATHGGPYVPSDFLKTHALASRTFYPPTGKPV